MTHRLLLLNGPNLDLLGTREPDLYGHHTLADVEELVGATAARAGWTVEAVQSNHEGVLIDAVHAARETCRAIVLNPGGLTHTSVALRDALTGVGLPVAEVHLTNIHAREEFRHHSYVSPIAAMVVCGAGIDGYRFAVERLVGLVDVPGIGAAAS